MDSQNLLRKSTREKNKGTPFKRGIYSDERRLHGETYSEFLFRHYSNFMHFFFEDWFLSAALAVITVAISVFMDVFIEYILHFKNHIYAISLEVSESFACAAWVSFISICVAISSLFCYFVSKEAVGSGIPEMKVIIQGFSLKNYLSFRTLLAKCVGLTVALGAGMPTGKEGPFVHIGAIVAQLLQKATKNCHFNDFYSNEGRKMELLSTGCAVGIACTFSSPAGAVLYGIESTSRYFAVKNYWRQFFATTCASLIFRFAINTMVPSHIVGTIVAYYQTSFPNEVFVIEEIPLFALVGVFSGLSGALYIWLHRNVALFRKKNRLYQSLFGKNPPIFTILMAVCFGLITFPPWAGRYIAGQSVFRETLADFISNCTFSASANSSVGCPEHILNRWTAGFEGNPVLGASVYGVFYYFVLVLFVSLYYPAGIFVPAFVVGACGGRVFGEFLASAFPEGIRGVGGPLVYPGLYAVVGAASFTGSVTRSLSVALIVCETTGQLCGFLPVLIALMIGNAIASFLQPSFYESLIKINNYPYLVELPPSRVSVHTMKVDDVMIRDVIHVTSGMTYRELKDLLDTTPHLRSFPVVKDKASKILLGSVSRKYLTYTLQRKIGYTQSFTKRRSSISEALIAMNIKRDESRDRERLYSTRSFVSEGDNTLLAHSPLHVTRSPQHLAPDVGEAPETSLSEQINALSHQINIEEMAIDSTPFQLVKGSSLYKVHTLFSLLALNHAYVTERGCLVGVVALKELREALNHIYLKGVIPLDRINQVKENTDTTITVNDQVHIQIEEDDED